MANKLIKLRGEVFTWIKLRIGNGLTCRFWTDNWSPYGSLESHLLTGYSSRQGIPATAYLADLCIEGNWQLPPARTDKHLELHVYLTTITLTDEPDYYEWILDDKVSHKYKTGEVYKKLRGEEDVVPWSASVWFSGGIAKQSFLTWLFTLNRCSTRDRMIQWGLQVDATCLLCNGAAESRNHLFYECSYTWAIWSTIARCCEISPLRNWSQTLTQMQNLNGNRQTRKITLLAWQSVVYWTWQERNKRLHHQQFRYTETLLKLICRQVKERILNFRIDSPANSSRLMQQWLSTDRFPPH
ncbi:hypothetical protein Bca52824_017217 [Brassica carinata]|uniref:Reverse transcriptase zinc-binding domain-containing protein n=1 Tax=Brassica carinata TaxID=52824 RepID=A0A8X8AW08_BRACI|nr:hypothetical protein Bca52824_017217 [Brassica carinata]